MVEDIFKRISVGKNYAKASILLLNYYVTDMQKPEDIAFNVYGDAAYHWVILLVNNIVDVRAEWPKSTDDLITYTSKKYGSLTDIHHWRTVQGKHIITPYPSLITAGTIKSINNLDHETEVNEIKRDINILDPQYLQEFVSNFQSQIRG